MQYKLSGVTGRQLIGNVYVCLRAGSRWGLFRGGRSPTAGVTWAAANVLMRAAYNGRV